MALSWLVYRLTHSAFMLGIVEGATLLPVMLLGLLGGWVADKADKKKVLLIAQMLSMCQAILLAVLTYTNHIEVWHCVALALFIGLINAFEIPCRQSFLPDLVERQNLVNAVSLNSSIFNGARIIGPAIAGILVPLIGEASCFFLNAASYLSTMIAYLLINAPHVSNSSLDKRHGFEEAASFIFASPTIMRLLFLGSIVSLCGMNYNVLMPVFASDILHGDIRTLAALRSGAGLGAFAAALMLASRGRGEVLKLHIGYATMLFSVCLIAFAWAQQYIACQILIVFVGFFLTTQLSGGHSLIQLSAKDELRGRVLSIYLIVMMGASPIGSFIIGWSAHKWGAPPVVTVCACICMLAGLIYSISAHSERTVKPGGLT